MGAFTPIGVEAIVRGIEKYNQDLKRMEGANSGASQSADRLGKVSETASKKVNLLGSMGLSTTALVLGLAAGLRKCVNEAMEAEQQLTMTEAMIHSTGGASGMTAQQLMTMSEEMAKLTGIEQEVIGAGENVLLKYTAIGRDVFPRVTQAVVDMGVSMSQGNMAQVDLKASAQMLGIALNTFDGYTRLQRQLGKFTDEQKANIERFKDQNDLVGYQNYILALLERRFGGVAEAMGDTTQGKMAKIKVLTNELAEAVGKELLPALSWLVTKMMEGLSTLDQLRTRNESLLAVEQEHVESLADLGASYEDYLTEMVRVSLVEEGSKDAMVEATQIIAEYRAGHISLTQLMTSYAGQVGILTEQQWRLTRATNDYGDSLLSLTENQKASKAQTQEYTDVVELEKAQLELLHQEIQGAVGAELTAYNDKLQETQDKMSGVQAKIAELEAKPFLTADEVQELTALRDEYGKLEASVTTLATAHEIAMGKIVYSMVEAKMAELGLADPSTMAAIAESLGIIDQPTADLITAVDTLTDSSSLLAGMASGTLAPAIEYLRSALDDGTISADELNAALDILNGKQISANITISTTWDSEDIIESLYGGHGGVYGGVEEQQRGGTVYRRKPYWVGERGAEPFFPAVSGRILSHADAMRALATPTRMSAPAVVKQINVAFGDIYINSGMDVATFEARVQRVIGGSL